MPRRAYLAKQGLLSDYSSTDGSPPEQSLARDAERLRVALETSQSGIWDWDLVTDHMFRSSFFERHLGHPPGSIGPDFGSWMTLVHHDDRERLTAAIDRYLDAGGIGNYDCEYRIRSGRGSWRWILDRGRITEWKNGVPFRFVGTHSDISFSRGMQEVLHVRETQLRAFVENSPAAIAITDAKGGYTMVNSMFSETFSLEAVDVLGKTSADIMPEDVASNEKHHNETVLSTLEPASFEYSLDFKGRRISRVVHKFPIVDDAGKVLGIGNMHADVTDFRENELALQDSHTKFQDYTELAADWYWETDAQMRFTSLSPTFAKHTSIDRNKFIGKTRAEMATDRKTNPEAWAKHLETLLEKKDFRGFIYETVDGNDEPLIMSVSGKPLFGYGGTFLGYRGTGRNITVEQTLSRKIEHEANHDPLTGLYNRRKFERELDNAMSGTGESFAVNTLCFLDLDRFKVVNDVAGHETGDRLLKSFSQMLRSKLSDSYALARLGGDEFGLLLRDCNVTDALSICRDIIESTRKFSFVDKGRSYQIGVSIGAVEAKPGTDSVADLLSLADNACFVAKNRGRNRVQVHRKNDNEAFLLRQQARRIFDLPAALENDRFVLFAHPIMPLSASLKGPGFFEVLTRLKASDGALLTPETFITAAERYGLAARIDRWVVTKAISTLGRCRTGLQEQVDPILSINLSGQSLDDENLYDFVRNELEENSVPGSAICFEITETAAVSNITDAKALISKLRKLGCRFALDDFGAGLSSFSYLKDLDVDYIKIDGQFVRGIHEDINRAVILAVQELAQTLFIKTVAEFVEDQPTVDFLKQSGIDYGQGFIWGRPQALESVLSIPTLQQSAGNIKLVHSKD